MPPPDCIANRPKTADAWVSVNPKTLAFLGVVRVNETPR
jgi:hypothetical protein